MIRKTIYVLGIAFLLWATFLFLPSKTKIEIFSALEKPYLRLRLSKPSCFVNAKILNQKIAQGLPAWAEAQIQEDLRNFRIIKRSDLDRYFKKYNSPFNKLARFHIKDQRVEVVVDDPALRKSRVFKTMLNVFEYLAKEGYIPDTDFVLGLQDYLKLRGERAVPFFTFAKDISVPVEKDLILIPDWMNIRGWPELKSRLEYAAEHFPWEQRQSLLFWRGGLADPTGFRHMVVALSKKHPDKIDAKFTEGKIQKAKFLPPELHLQYKYQISLDGARATWERLVWQLHSQSLVFKNNSTHKQWFHKGIEPYIDYIPVVNKRSLLKDLALAEKQPERIKEIVQHATEFAKNNLELEDMYHYIIALINAYNEKLR